MEEHSYIVNPFADIICTICQYTVKVNTSIFIAINQHERKNGNHPIPYNENKRKAIAVELNRTLKEVALRIWSLCNEDNTLANEYLQQYLSQPAISFMYCAACEVLVKDKMVHKRNKHFTSCKEAKLGYKILNWEKNDPKIVPFPINVEDRSIFGAMFQAELSQLLAKSSLAVVPIIIL